MKAKLLAGLMALTLGSAAVAQPSDIWQTPAGIYSIPPDNGQIDAITFINPSGSAFDFSGSELFKTSDTLNYTNRGTMTGFPGFDFETYPTAFGQASPAVNFANLVSGPNNGIINCNGTFAFVLAPGLIFGNLAGNAKMLVRATNIVNSGTINMSASSLLSMKGQNIDLTRGSLQMANPGNTIILGTNIIILPGVNSLFSAGILDGWWGAQTATNGMNPTTFPAGISPLHLVTNRNYFVLLNQLFLPTPVAYVNQLSIDASNALTQAVFLYNFDPAFVNTVYFTPAEIAVQWQWASTNWPSRTSLTTNYMYLTDNFGEVTNLGVAVNGYINPQATYPTPTYRPINYQIIAGAQYNPALTPATPGLLPNVFPDVNVTNQYTGYEAIFIPGTSLTTDIANGNPTNMAGRIELTGDNTLNLAKSRISSLNYLLLKATNHFLGSAGATISSPYSDLYLRTTNASLTVSNTLMPFLNHPYGDCELYSARWTNVINNITNRFHVLYVYSALQPTSPSFIQTLQLNVTNFTGARNNLVINDVLNVTSNLLLNCEAITIATNAADAFTPVGQLNLVSGNVLWPNSLPRLQNLTNFGVISTFNGAFFGGSHTPPPYNSNLVNVPYETFVNHGTIVDYGSLIWSKYFENTGGFIESFQGTLQLEQCNAAWLDGGVLYAGGGDVGLKAGTLSISNTMLISGGALEFWVTNAITDGGGLFNLNSWTTVNGFDLYVKPATGDLLGTTVSSFSTDYAETLNFWAGEDRGRSTAGYLNDVAVGRLILSGGTNSTMRFIGTGANNALYVDSLELRDSMTNRDTSGNFIGLVPDPNMKIYFAQAIANGVSVAEKMNGKNNGQLVWVSDYAGLFSSTNMLYPDGNTYTFNLALVQSKNIDSDGDGIPNFWDPTPIFVSSQVQLLATITNRPLRTVLTWNTIANSTNTVYYHSSPTSANWQVLTNFVYGPVSGKAVVSDPLTTSNRLYRVRVDVRRP